MGSQFKSIQTVLNVTDKYVNDTNNEKKIARFKSEEGRASDN